MYNDEITFDKLPQAITYLIEQVESRNLMLAPSILRHLRGLLSEDSTDGPVKTPENFEINTN